MKLHSRGVEFVVELLEAAEHVDHFSANEQRVLLRETAHVLAELLKRDVPNYETSSDEIGIRPEDLNATNDD